MTTTHRTFESFEIRWDRGSSWTGYNTAAEAQAIVDQPVWGEGEGGYVVRKTWEVELRPELLARGMYQPGCGDRVEVTA